MSSSELTRLGEKLSENVVLVETLRLAVPFQIQHLSTWDDRARQGLTRELATLLGTYGDVLQFGGKNCALAFNTLARGLAILAYRPGGITFGGLHWCVGSGHAGTNDPAPCNAELKREIELEKGGAACAS